MRRPGAAPLAVPGPVQRIALYVAWGLGRRGDRRLSRRIHDGRDLTRDHRRGERMIASQGWGDGCRQVPDSGRRRGIFRP